MKELDDWLRQDERRTAILCRAMSDGEMKYCAILHDFANWSVSDKEFPGESRKTYPVQKLVYADTLEEAVLGALRQ